MTFQDCKAEIQGGGLWSGHGALLGLGGDGGNLELTRKKAGFPPLTCTVDGNQTSPKNNHGLDG